MTLVAAFLGWMFDGFEMGLFPLVGREALKDLLGPSGHAHVDAWFSVMIAGFLVGAATGGVLFGWLGDRLGRVRAMTVSVLTYAIFMGLCGVAKTPLEVFVYRFISSLGMGGEWSLGVALVMEIWPDKSRGLLAGLIGAASNVGFLLIALIGLGLGEFIGSADRLLLQLGLPQPWVDRAVANSGWRLMMIIGALPALLTFFIRLFVPESRRWEEERRHGSTSFWATRDLLAVVIGACGPLAMIYLWSPETSFPLALRIGGSIAGLVVAAFGFVYPVTRYLQRSQSASTQSVLPQSAPRQSAPTPPSSASQTATRDMLARMLLGACVSGVALLGTWGSVQWAPAWASKIIEAEASQRGREPGSAEIKAASSSARSLTQIISGLGAIVGTMIGALACNAIGRRPTYSLLCIASLASSLLFYQGNDSYGPLFLLSVFLLGGSTASFYGWLPLYLPELFPTRVRATGQGFSFNFGRILAAIGALQTGNLMASFGGNHAKACTALSLVYLVGVAIIWLAPETRGKPLPE